MHTQPLCYCEGGEIVDTNKQKTPDKLGPGVNKRKKAV